MEKLKDNFNLLTCHNPWAYFINYELIGVTFLNIRIIIKINFNYSDDNLKITM